MLVQAASKHSYTSNAITATAPAMYELESLPVDQQTTLALMVRTLTFIPADDWFTCPFYLARDAT